MQNNVPPPDGQLHRIFPTAPDRHVSTTVDIIAIHGLATTSPRTWLFDVRDTHGKMIRQVNWLNDHDMLPAVIPDAEIYTFNWNSTYYENAPVVRIQDVADSLLNVIKNHRDQEQSHRKPLIFIASCFGGLIVTKALEIANIHGSSYRHILLATSGVVFLASPLQGTRAVDAARWRNTLAGILKKSPSDTLLQDLDGSTGALWETTSRFVKMIRKHPMKIMTHCFFETQNTQVLNAILPKSVAKYVNYSNFILVEKDSACLIGLPSLCLDANHAMMNKFRGPEDANFKQVSQVLINMVRQAPEIAAFQLADTPEATSSCNKHFISPARLPSTLFTGREEELEILREALCSSSSRRDSITYPRIYVIHGMGGAGKSEVALRFLHLHREEFWGAFWIDAHSKASIEHGFADIAVKCKLAHDSVESVRSFLAETPRSWLLVLDNADDPNFDYAPFLPANKEGSILITSRVSECGIHQTVGKDAYGRLPERTAIDLLLKTCEIDVGRREIFDSDAQEIVRLLGHHALAIIQAGSFIRKGLCKIDEYETFFQSEHKQLMEFHASQAKSEYGNVYATFEVSATYLKGLNNRMASDALELLSFLAFMHFADIPMEIFGRSYQYAKNLIGHDRSRERDIKALTSWHVSHLPKFMRGPADSDLDWISLRKARSLLAELSLISVDDSDSMQMHPVIHMWARDRLTRPEDSESAWIQVVAVLSISVGELPAFRADDQEQDNLYKLVTHIEAVSRMKTFHHLSRERFEIQQAFYRIFQVPYVLNCTSSAAAVALEMVIEMLPLEADKDWRATPNGQAVILLHAEFMIEDCDPQAIELLQELVAIRTEMWDEEDPRVLEILRVLAWAYQRTHPPSPRKATIIIEKLIKIEEKLSADEKEGILTSQRILASIYPTENKAREALEIMEKQVKLREERLGENHLYTLTAQSILAEAYSQTGESAKAGDLGQKLVSRRRKIQRKEHPNFLWSLYNLAYSYHWSKMNSEALRCAIEVESVFKESRRARMAYKNFPDVQKLISAILIADPTLQQ